jgi:hypothetical protein
VPILKPDDIAIMDNLGSHKSASPCARSSSRPEPRSGSCRPTRGPHPLKQAFAKIKHWMRIAQKYSIADTWRHIGAITADECENYLANAGYASAKT